MFLFAMARMALGVGVGRTHPPVRASRIIWALNLFDPAPIQPDRFGA